MNPDDLTIKSFLDELYRQTKGDLNTQVSMYEVGSGIGLNKSEAGSLAESLMVDGLVELKTLAGGIAITSEGLANLGFSVPSAPAGTQSLHFSKGLVTNDQDRQVIQLVTRQIKDSLSGHSTSYDNLEEMVIDLKTIELHMLSPRPKVAIVRELLRSLHAALVAADIKTMAYALKPLLG